MGRIILSICAVVVAGALGGSAQGPGDGPGGEASADERNASSRENVQVTTDLGRIASALEAQSANADPDREQRDLNAQEGMAIWAQAMFWAACAQALLSLVGIILIYITFQQTRRAADSADKMAEEAARTTKAALRSATVAEQALVGIERPFLVFEPGQRLGNAQYYSFVNHGRTPCVILRSDVRFLPVTPLNAPDPITANVLQAALTPDWNIVGPNGDASGTDFVRLGKPIVPDAELAELLMLHGYVLYRSLAGATFVSGFGLLGSLGKPWKPITVAGFNYDERLEKGRPRKRTRPTLTVTASQGPHHTE